MDDQFIDFKRKAASVLCRKINISDGKCQDFQRLGLNNITLVWWEAYFRDWGKSHCETCHLCCNNIPNILKQPKYFEKERNFYQKKKKSLPTQRKINVNFLSLLDLYKKFLWKGNVHNLCISMPTHRSSDWNHRWGKLYSVQA